MADFNTWGMETARAEIAELVPGWVAKNILFYYGDHLQNMDGWTGPLMPTTHSGYNQYNIGVARVFVSRNAIAEIVKRHTAAVVGKRIKWKPVLKRPLVDDDEPTPDEQTLLDEVQTLLDEWFDGQQAIIDRRNSSGIRKTDVQEALQQMTTFMLLARRGILRLVINPAAVTTNEDGGTGLPVGAPADIMRQLFVATPEPTQAAVITDSTDMASCGAYVYSIDDKQYAELTYLDENGRTVLRIIGDEEREAPPPLDLGGRLFMFETQRDELPSESVRQQQMALNKSETGQSVNLDHAQRERVFINVSPPGVWQDDPDNPGQSIFVPGDLNVGAATASFFQTSVTENGDGTISQGTGSVNYFGPDPATVYIDSSEDYWQGILAEADQLHVAISGDASASGKSRIEAKDDFRKSLSLTAPRVAGAARWLLETVLKLTAVLSNDPARYDGISIHAECRIDVGTPDADEIRVISEALKAGLISQYSAVARVSGADDVEAEIQMIHDDQANQLDILTKQATVYDMLIMSGIERGLAAEMAGYPQEIIDRLLQTPQLGEPGDGITQ